MEGGGGAYRLKWQQSRALRLQTRVGGLGPKTQNRAQGLGFGLQLCNQELLDEYSNPFWSILKGGAGLGRAGMVEGGGYTHLVPHTLSNSSPIPPYPPCLPSTPS